MFFTQNMYMVKIFALDEVVDKLCSILYEFGLIEVKRASDFIEGKEGVQLLDNSNLVKESEILGKRIREAMEVIDVEPVDEGVHIEISTKMAERLRHEFGGILDEIEMLSRRMNDNQKRIDELTVRAMVLSAVDEKKIPLDSFKKSENVVAAAGVVPKEYLREVKSFNEEGVAVEIKEEFLGNLFLFCVALKEKESRLRGVLRNVKFQEVTLDFEAPDIGEAIESLEIEIWKLREDSVECRRRLNEIKKVYSGQLSRALCIVEENERIYRTMDRCLVSRRGHVVTGWVPESKLSALKKSLKSLGSAVYMEVERAEDMVGRGISVADIPSYLGHKLLRPFENLVRLYGVPAYRHVDPTFLMSASFVTMFGMMFGDLGHGLSLFVLALGMGFFKRLREAAKILGLCGVSGAFFGMLFGSVFGREDIVRPLWFNPTSQPEKFLLIGIGFGIIMITLGITLNIIQNIRNRKPVQAVFSQWGIVSIVFYWMILFIAAASLRYHLNLSLGWLLVLFFLPLGIIVLGNLLWHKDSDVAEIIFTPVEIVMSLLTNTISFVRVAAFGLAHAALGACVYLVAYSMGNVAGLKESLIVEGNIGIILFEGLIVFIQALRLEFYEFFSKFFMVQGREFKPLKERG